MLHAQVVERIVDEARLEVRLLAHEAAGGHHLVHDEPGLEGGEIKPLLLLQLVTMASKTSSGSVMPWRLHSCSKMRR